MISQIKIQSKEKDVVVNIIYDDAITEGNKEIVNKIHSLALEMWYPENLNNQKNDEQEA